MPLKVEIDRRWWTWQNRLTRGSGGASCSEGNPASLTTVPIFSSTFLRKLTTYLADVQTIIWTASSCIAKQEAKPRKTVHILWKIETKWGGFLSLVNATSFGSLGILHSRQGKCAKYPWKLLILDIVILWPASIRGLLFFDRTTIGNSGSHTWHGILVAHSN